MLDRAFGMDVHQETIVVAKLLPDRKETKRFSVSALQKQRVRARFSENNMVGGRLGHKAGECV